MDGCLARVALACKQFARRWSSDCSNYREASEVLSLSPGERAGLPAEAAAKAGVRAIVFSIHTSPCCQTILPPPMEGIRRARGLSVARSSQGKARPHPNPLPRGEGTVADASRGFSGWTVVSLVWRSHVNNLRGDGSDCSNYREAREAFSLSPGERAGLPAEAAAKAGVRASNAPLLNLVILRLQDQWPHLRFR